ncbi:MAG: CBS domain-containing protein [Halobacteria archaeon]|nr:CBS domain-containing protein [Halobacteria archaeon]
MILLDIEETVSTDYEVFGPETRVSKLRGFFEETNRKAAIIGDGKGEGDGYKGVVTLRRLVSSHHDPDQKAKSVMTNPPKVGRREDVREVARLMIEGTSKVLPVFEGDALYGIVTADDLLRDVNSNLSVLSVADVYTEEMVEVRPDTTVGEIINTLRENGISRVPVIEDGSLEGMVTRYDIIGFSVRDMNKDNKGGGGHGEEHGGHGSRQGEEVRMLDIPARDIMNSPVETVEVDENLEVAVEKMLEMGYSSLVVTRESEGRKQNPVGIVTKTDVLKSLTWTEEENLDVQISNIDLLDTMSREDVAEMIEDVASKYSEMQVLNAHVHLKKHKEKMRGNPLILVRMNLHTNKGQFVGTDEGYGAKHALRLACDKLERQVLSAKGVERTDRDAQRMLKDIGI